MDHPRSRGVYYFGDIKFNGGEGSSPLARGLRSTGSSRRPGSGIIPARAGFTHGQAAGPRHNLGSSPLARGLHRWDTVLRYNNRIIPARAGYTYRKSRADLRQPDHPRSRGVYLPDGSIFVTVGGSSPLARGLRHDGAGGAHAFRDHPRSRGVYTRLTTTTGTVTGSSPLARGLLIEIKPEVSDIGIIPARAGFTSIRASILSPRADHPRSRGVYSAVYSTVSLPPGSSPLARGLRRPTGG